MRPVLYVLFDGYAFPFTVMLSSFGLSISSKISSLPLESFGREDIPILPECTVHLSPHFGYTEPPSITMPTGFAMLSETPIASALPLPTA